MPGELFSHGDNGKVGNVSDPMVVGPDPAWPEFVSFLFAGVNANGENCIIVLNPANGQFGYFQDFGTAGNVSHPVVVGFYEQWLEFKFLSAGQNMAGQNRIYAVRA
jgi:hypothetical protein